MTTSQIRRGTLTLAALLGVLFLAACGSSSSTSASTSISSAAGSGTSSGRAALTACLKKHGVTLPARPSGGYKRPNSSGSESGAGAGTGGGFFGGGGSGPGGGRFSNPKFRAALKACGGGNFAGGGRRFALNHSAVTTFASCVKQHGYNLPAPNFSGSGPIFPRTVESNAKFQKAAKACASDLRPAGSGAPGAPPAGGGAPPSAGTSTTAT